MTRKVPTGKQASLAALPVGPVLLVAPAGCGKTEALALRATTVVARGEVAPPRRVLGLTFSNKAKENLQSRIRALAGPGWRQMTTVTNFHGLASRLIRSHGEVAGLDPMLTLPDHVWRRKTIKELGAEWDDKFEFVLRTAKADDADDDTVMARLQEAGYAKALEYEELLRSTGRIDFDDQLRHAARILKDKDVARLYRAHFGLVIVDEVQDLSMRQLGIVVAVGAGRTTYAGDHAQGIYSFAGAEPEAVFASIYAESPTVITLDESYRSSPAVLKAVNAVAALTDDVKLTCGAPQNFPDSGHVLMLEADTTATEAADISDFLAGHDLEATSIGVIARRWGRLAHIRQELNERAVPFTDWSAPTHIARVVELLRRQQPVAKGATALDRLDDLERLCTKEVDADDSATYDEILMACDDLRALCETGASYDDALAACRTAPEPDEPIAPGIHLLSGHVGKGQEFDWVVVVGMEDGHVPNYLATTDDDVNEERRLLHVMLSRARYSLVLTYSAYAPRRAGGWFGTTRSRWLPALAPVVTDVL